MIELSGLNSRMKDFYDVYRLLASGNYEPAILREAIQQTFMNRNTSYMENHLLFSTEFALDPLRNRMWLAFLKKIGRKDSIAFQDIISEIHEVLLPVWESLNISDN